jgi:hypothetical protein
LLSVRRARAESRDFLLLRALFLMVSCKEYGVTVTLPTDQKEGQSKSIHGYPIVSRPVRMSTADQNTRQLFFRSRDTYLENAGTP